VVFYLISNLCLCFICDQLDDELDLTDWVEKIAAVNTDAELNAKAIPAFLSRGNQAFGDTHPPQFNQHKFISNVIYLHLFRYYR